ncbi:hypothetical protein ACLB2K_023690 [Fragaria x ananassa]
MTNGFRKKLGDGGFGSVFSGKLPSNGVPVAIKVLKDSKGNGDDFVNEVGTIGRIHHVNMVRLLGFSAEEGKRALIYEDMPNSSLEKFITSKDNNASFDWMKLRNIITGIAKGIEYLHQGCDQRILHFDIKPHNILLDHDFNPKISDFGLAKLCSKEDSLISMTAARGTIGYIAPEVFNGNFGTVCNKWSMFSNHKNLYECLGKYSFNRKSLHAIGSTPNPYEQAISIIGRTLSPFDEDNIIPCFGFGDASTHDVGVFSFYPDDRCCVGFEEALARYREIVPYLRLSGT